MRRRFTIALSATTSSRCSGVMSATNMGENKPNGVLPRDTVPLPGLETEIQSVHDQYEALLLWSARGQKLSSLRRQHENPESELFGADDIYPGHERDELEIEALRSKLESTANQLEQLELSYEAQQTASLESRLDSLNQQKVRHEALIDLSKAQPPSSLTNAVILVSSPVCEDCVKFNNKVNQYKPVLWVVDTAFCGTLRYPRC